MSQKTRIKKISTYITTASEVSRNWFVLDASGKTLGRFAAEVAKLLRGKHKTTFTPHADDGDGVIIINCEKISVTGAKKSQKVYRYHTGFVGGLREIPFRVMQERKPEYIIESAVKGMMPKTRQGNAQLRRLHIFAGEQHNMEAQKPIKANI